jgi:NAD(P)-dependent dehydrogenase (short-subunit alcohol dehydrogenase family)
LYPLSINFTQTLVIVIVMISNLLKCGAIMTVLMAVLVGLVLYTTLPRKMGIYRMMASFNPMLVGMSPAFLEGVEWKYSWEQYYSPATMDMLKGQNAIVTGGNSGIGFDLAMALVSNGVDVTITCRSEAKCKTAKKKIDAKDGSNKGKLHVMLMDTSSFASVRSFCETYLNTFPHEPIDMLFFNAGTTFLNLKNPEDNPKCTPKTQTDGIEYLFQVNYLSHHLMYRLLEPYLSPTARIIQTSSAAAFSTYSYRVATDVETLHGCSETYISPSSGENLSYGQSKLAQDIWCKALTRRLSSSQDFGGHIAANAFHPGLVNTGIFGKALEISDMPKMIEDYLRSIILPKFAWQSPDGALTGLYLATRNSNSGIQGKYFHPQAEEVINPLALDEDLQDKLWEFSDALVKDYLTPIQVAGAETEMSQHESVTDIVVEEMGEAEEEQTTVRDTTVSE